MVAKDGTIHSLFATRIHVFFFPAANNSILELFTPPRNGHPEAPTRQGNIDDLRFYGRLRINPAGKQAEKCVYYGRTRGMLSANSNLELPPPRYSFIGLADLNAGGGDTARSVISPR